MTLYPLLLEPTLHVKVWGGRRLETVLGKKLPTSDPYGEAWELHDTSTIANGALAGRTLGDVLREYGRDLVGSWNNPQLGVPLLVKFLDASEWLSVQVHPNDQQARELEGDPRGKTEAWVILDADPPGGQPAQLVLGVKPGTSRDTVAQAVRENTLEGLLVFANVETGDALYMPAGTIHAIGPGLLIYEIQQSSDTTYRLYDWGRMDLDGKPRPLHVEKAVNVANVETLPIIEHSSDDDEMHEIVRGSYFTTLIFTITPEKPLQFFMHRDVPLRRFHALTCIEGSFTVEAIAGASSEEELKVLVEKGRTVMIPAYFDGYIVTAQTPRARALCSYQTIR